MNPATNKIMLWVLQGRVAGYIPFLDVVHKLKPDSTIFCIIYMFSKFSVSDVDLQNCSIQRLCFPVNAFEPATTSSGVFALSVDQDASSKGRLLVLPGSISEAESDMAPRL